jgi:hypothetical protein
MIVFSSRPLAPAGGFQKKTGAAATCTGRSGLPLDLRRGGLPARLILFDRPRTGAFDTRRSGFAERLFFLTVGDPLQQPG